MSCRSVPFIRSPWRKTTGGPLPPVPSALVTLTLTDAERLCDRLNAWFSLTREELAALVARSMRSDTASLEDEPVR